MIPNHLVHYYLPDKTPFLNLNDLSETDLKTVVEEINQDFEVGNSKRQVADWYLIQRKEAEENLLKEFQALGGKPERSSPHYFCLGESLGWEWVNNHKTKKFIVPIDELDCEVMFSIGDTLWTFSKSQKPDQKFENKWYQGKLYTYAQTCEIIKEIGLDLKSKGSLNAHQVFHVEALIWSDKAIEKLNIKQEEKC
jgi:hypothetical protein